MNVAAQGSHHSPLSALSNFHDLVEVLAENFEANATLEDKPGKQVIVVLGASASDVLPFPSWDTDLKKRVLKKVGKIFKKEDYFLQEICRVFSGQFGRYLGEKYKDKRREAILRDARVEQISNVACQMLGHADFIVRDIISKAYKPKGEAKKGPPPHLTYELLAHLVMHGFINHIVTMNFDEMLDTALENELGPRGFKKIITGHEPPEDGEPRVPRLFKVHGTASSPESLRFTHTEVSVLTYAQTEHLNALLKSASTPDCECLNLVSFGYSWKDADLANWVLAHLERFERVFIIRRGSGEPEKFRIQFENSPQLADRFKVISINDLCRSRKASYPPASSGGSS